MMKYYLAYGSNLSVEQMEWRCPTASTVGYAILKDYRLLFRSGFLTIEPKTGSEVPVLVWQVGQSDEAALDRYEGWPRFYRRETMKAEVLDLSSRKPIETTDAFVYVMNDGFELRLPSEQYWNVCLEGYQRFGFDTAILEQALRDSVAEN